MLYGCIMRVIWDSVEGADALITQISKYQQITPCNATRWAVNLGRVLITLRPVGQSRRIGNFNSNSNRLMRCERFRNESSRGIKTGLLLFPLDSRSSRNV